MEKNTTSRIRIAMKLFENGYKTEKDILGLTMDKILALPKISITEMQIISNFQKAIKANKGISFLGCGSDKLE